MGQTFFLLVSGATTARHGAAFYNIISDIH